MKRRIPPGLESLEGRSLLSGLAASLTTDQATYQPGQPVVMTFRETNDSDGAIQVGDGPSLDGFMVAQGGKTIWQSNAGINPMFVQMVTLQPGDSLTLSATWDGVPEGGSGLATGTFTITDQLDPGASATVTIGGSSSTPDPSPSPPASHPHPIGVATNPDPGPAPSSSASSRPISRDPKSALSTTDPGSAPIAVSVSTDHPTYHAGQRVRIRMTLRNVGDSAVALPKGPAGRFMVLEGSTPVWHRFRGLARTLEPGQSMTLSAVWNGRSHGGGVPLSQGTYTIEADAGDASASTILRLTG